MKKILGFAGSNSSTSINAQLVKHVLGRLSGVEANQINFASYLVPMYDIDVEERDGIPKQIKEIHSAIRNCDALVISVNEHNGSMSAFFKNIVDWLSREDKNFVEGRPILLMSTSPGKGGAKKSLAYAKDTFPKFGGNVVESFSFPSFQENFSEENNSIKNPQLDAGVGEVIASFLAQI